MSTARFQFDEPLMELLAHARRHDPVVVDFSGPQTAKHLIESMGIPHTEVREVSSGRGDLGLDSVVRDGDVLMVSGVVMQVTVGEPTFVLDGHLGRLAADLRMLGFDCGYQRQPSDRLLARISATESRILLTRDRRLLMRKEVLRGCLVRSELPDCQLAQIWRRYDLLRWIRPFRRCIRCNELLEPVNKASVVHRLPPLTRLYYDEFRVCPGCCQPYWAGSHLKAMQAKVRGLIARSGSETAG